MLQCILKWKKWIQCCIIFLLSLFHVVDAQVLLAICLYVDHQIHYIHFKTTINYTRTIKTKLIQTINDYNPSERRTRSDRVHKVNEFGYIIIMFLFYLRGFCLMYLWVKTKKEGDCWMALIQSSFSASWFYGDRCTVCVKATWK